MEAEVLMGRGRRHHAPLEHPDLKDRRSPAFSVEATAGSVMKVQSRNSPLVGRYRWPRSRKPQSIMYMRLMAHLPQHGRHHHSQSRVRTCTPLLLRHLQC